MLHTPDVQDRVAANMLSYGEDIGRVGGTSGTQQLVEPTSGNTGLALAMVRTSPPQPVLDRLQP